MTRLRVLMTGELLRNRATGLEQYAAQLTAALLQRDDVEITLLVEDTAHAAQFGGNVRMLVQRPPGIAGKSAGLRGLWYHVAPPPDVRSFDVVHFPNVIPPFMRWPRGPGYVMTVHDLIPLAMPEDQTRLGRLYFRAALPRLARRVDRFITVSDHTRQDLARWYGVPNDRVSVTPLASRWPALSPAEVKPKEPFVLAVGSVAPRKNLPRLLRAFIALKRRRPDLPDRLLLIGGALWWSAPELRELVTAHPQWIEQRGYVSDRELHDLYTRAKGAVVPSLYEGFGLPVLEAMAAGCPVAASDRTSIPEVAGDAAVPFDPSDEAAIGGALESLLSDAEQRQQLIAAGLARAAAFSWERCAAETLEAYRRAAVERKDA